MSDLMLLQPAGVRELKVTAKEAQTALVDCPVDFVTFRQDGRNFLAWKDAFSGDAPQGFKGRAIEAVDFHQAAFNFRTPSSAAKSGATLTGIALLGNTMAHCVGASAVPTQRAAKAVLQLGLKFSVGIIALGAVATGVAMTYAHFSSTSAKHAATANLINAMTK